METYAYSTSKAAVHQLTRHLAKFLAPTITVNAIAPGPFESRMMHATIQAVGDDIVKAAPMKRLGQPSDMAGTAIFLASPAASYITGAVIPVDGGLATLCSKALFPERHVDHQVFRTPHDVQRDALTRVQ